ncbi:MAG: type II toxin-antitoxin system VapC family toxin [Luteolibacter sp.]
MIYIDTSSFLKLVRQEEDSAVTIRAVASETAVILSQLTRLEVEVQLRAQNLGGILRTNLLKSILIEMDSFVAQPPFQRMRVSADLFEIALKQHRSTEIHCRSLDRLHLAAMEELRVKRLLTHDVRQAAAARELGIEVVTPGVV